MALGGMQAMRVTSAKRDTDMGSSGDATLKSQPGISGDRRRDLHHPAEEEHEIRIYASKSGHGILQKKKEGRAAGGDFLLEPFDFGWEAARYDLASCYVRNQVGTQRSSRCTNNSKRKGD